MQYSNLATIYHGIFDKPSSKNIFLRRCYAWCGAVSTFVSFESDLQGQRFNKVYFTAAVEERSAGGSF